QPFALNARSSANGWSQYRQVTVIDGQGQTACFTGKEALGTHHAVQGEQCVASASLPVKQAVCPCPSITVTCRYWLQPFAL
ncbi:DUF1028 domain-containing protein, partial [Burkholderia cenocepacia]|uniref:DUF1028 domain-containing protein n=1 Tax=Burkholderia cenocepacia TaxID=95486 RepID=UPI0024B64062